MLYLGALLWTVSLQLSSSGSHLFFCSKSLGMGHHLTVRRSKSTLDRAKQFVLWRCRSAADTAIRFDQTGHRRCRLLDSVPGGIRSRANRPRPRRLVYTMDAGALAAASWVGLSWAGAATDCCLMYGVKRAAFRVWSFLGLTSSHLRPPLFSHVQMQCNIWYGFYLLACMVTILNHHCCACVCAHMTYLGHSCERTVLALTYCCGMFFFFVVFQNSA